MATLPHTVDAGAPVGTVLPESPLRSRPDGQAIVLDNIDWASYRKISDALTGAKVRLSYDRGRLELMTRSSAHGSWKSFLGRMIEVLSEEAGLPIRGCGEMTCDREALLRGIEPDDCFYLANELKVRGKNPLVAGVDPPPDLALEIEVTKSSLSKLPIYAALGVAEVWRFDGKALTFHQLRETQYVVVEHSPTFRFVKAADILTVLLQWGQADDNTLIRSFRQWLRSRLA